MLIHVGFISLNIHELFVMRIENAQNKEKRRVEPHRNSLSYFEKFSLFKVVSICNR